MKGCTVRKNQDVPRNTFLYLPLFLFYKSGFICVICFMIFKLQFVFHVQWLSHNFLSGQNESFLKCFLAVNIYISSRVICDLADFSAEDLKRVVTHKSIFAVKSFLVLST